jgi:hypothetical protein
MDIRLFANVVGRHRGVALAGLVLALILATLSFVRVEFEDGRIEVGYRQAEGWVSQMLLLVTQEGFSFGDSVTTQEQQEVEGRLTGLATIYAGFATGDAVLDIVRRSGPINGKLESFAVQTADEAPLPVVAIKATSWNGEAAQSLANRGADGLMQYLEFEQRANRIPSARRVKLEVLNRPNPPQLVSPRTKTLPVVVFLTVLFATVGACFILENLRSTGSRRAEEEDTRDRGSADQDVMVAVRQGAPHRDTAVSVPQSHVSASSRREHARRRRR